MMKINDVISYIPKSKEPLSAEVFIMQNHDGFYLYDVGNGDYYIEEIKKLKGNKKVVLSHFHPDHLKNVHMIDYDVLYQSKNTAKYTKIVGCELDRNVIDFPSTHAKGCLALLFDDYLFVGDALYPNDKGLYNVNFIKEQMNLIKKLNISYIVCSHHEPLVLEKEYVLKQLNFIYSKRDPKNMFVHKDSTTFI